MTDYPQIRILHLSDIHFGSNHICNAPDPTGASAGIPTLADSIQADLKAENWASPLWAAWSGEPGTPLLLAITGDLTQKAARTEFDAANALIDQLANSKLLDTKVGIRNTFIVPGNHDVIFSEAASEHRFGQYCQFYNKLYSSIQPDERAFARPEKANQLSQIHSFPEARFLIAEINSCLYVEKETDDESRGQVDHESIAELRRQLAECPPDAHQWIKVALIHHHPVLLPSFVEAGRGYDSIVNSSSLLGILRENGFQLILHGHKHYPQVFSYDPDPAWAEAESAIPQLIVAGGSCGSKALPDGTRQCNTYNLITIKWNPSALQARIQVVTRGLNRTGPAGSLDPDLWSWGTLRNFDRILSPYEGLPLPGPTTRVNFPENPDACEQERKNLYSLLRHNMPVAEVMPSLMPGQGYEARIWIERHRYHRESPIRVQWSAGKMFARKICESNSAPEFCVSFHYWGPMIIQAELEFADGEKVCAHVYARLPESTMRR